MKLGDIPVVIDGRDCFLRPDIIALMEIEDTLGKGLLQLATEAKAYRIGIRDVVEIVYCCLKSGSGEIPRSLVEKEIGRQGLTYFLGNVSDVIEVGLAGPKKQVEPPSDVQTTESLGGNILEQPLVSLESSQQNFTD